MPTHELVIDHAGNWIFKPIRPPTQAQRPAPSSQPPPAHREEPNQAQWPALEPEPALRAAPILPSAEVYARRAARVEPLLDICTKAGMAAVLRATKAHLDAYPGDIHAALVAAKAFGANPDGERAKPLPPPRVWPYGMSEARATKMFEAAFQVAQATASADERPGAKAATGDGAVPASTEDSVSPYDPVFGPGVNFDDSALDAYGQPYRIAGAPVTKARTQVVPDEKKTATPRSKKKRPSFETPALDLHNLTAVPFVDDQGNTLKASLF